MSTSPEVIAIALDKLMPSLTDSQKARRASFDKAALDELADSIKVSGILQPIVVRHVAAEQHAGVKVPAHYEIVAGERRWKAAKLAGLAEIPATVRELSDAEVVQVQTIENLQREGLHPMHEAEAYEQLRASGVPIDEIPAKVCKSIRYVYQRIKLLALCAEARKAFYAGEISVAVADVIARVPTHALQKEALRDVVQMNMGAQFGRASEHVAKKYMTQLKGAPFDVADVTLPGGACGVCPKRTGNQPNLFDDVGNADVCTDSACFAKKVRTAGTRAIAAAKTEGRKVIVGEEAKKLGHFRYSDEVNGYYKLDGQVWHSGQHRRVKTLLKEDAEVALFADPDSGRAIEIVHRSQLKPQDKAPAPARDSYAAQQRENQKRARYENAVRMRVFADVFPKLAKERIELRTVAEALAGSMDYNAWEKVRPFYVEAGLCTKDLAHYSIAKTLLPKLKTGAQLSQWIAVCWLGRELHVSSYDRAPGMPRLESAAKAAGVNVAAIRKELKPKPKKKSKKKAGKRRGKK